MALVDRIPEIERVVGVDQFHVDQAGMAAGLVSDQAVFAVALGVDPDRQAAAADRIVALIVVDQADLFMQLPQRLLGRWR